MNNTISWLLVCGPIVVSIIGLAVFMCAMSHPLLWFLYIGCATSALNYKPERHIVDLD